MANTPPLFNPFTKPGFLIRRLQQVSVRLFQEAVGAYGLTTIQYGALQVIGGQPGIDQVTLSRETDIDRTTIVRVVDKLRELGLIRKETSPEDRRVNRIHITDAGIERLREAYDAAEASQDLLLSPLAPAERDAFKQMMSTVILTHAGEESPMAQLAARFSPPEKNRKRAKATRPAIAN
jgi:DNA-binding MarR family transcriptional regulator